MSPRLSLLLGTYMAEQRVGPIIERALSLDLDMELIVIDNASTDGTFDIVRAFTDPRLVVSQNPANIGGLRNLDLLLQRARGDYLAYLTDDDLVYPSSIGKKFDVLDRNSNIDVVFTRYDNRLPDGTFVDLSGHPLFPPHSYIGRTDEFETLLRSCYFMLTTVMFRRTALAKVSGRYGLDPRHVVADWDLWLRLTRNARTAYIAEAGIENAVRDTGSTADYLKLGHFVWGRLRIWRRFLVQDANPPVLYPRDWQEMWNNLVNDARSTWGQDAPLDDLERRLATIQRQYIENTSRLAQVGPSFAGQAEWLERLVAAGKTADCASLLPSSMKTNLELIARWCPVLSEVAPGAPFAVSAPFGLVSDINVWRDDIECATQAETTLVKIGEDAAVIGWLGQKSAPREIAVLLIAPSMDSESLLQHGLPLVSALREVRVRADIATAADVAGFARYDVVHVLGVAPDLGPFHELRVPVVVTDPVALDVALPVRAADLASLYSRTIAAGAQWAVCPDWSDPAQWQPVVQKFINAVGPDDRMTLHLYAGVENGTDTTSGLELLDAYISASAPFAGVLPDIRVTDVIPGERVATGLLLGNIHDRRMIDFFGERRIVRNQWNEGFLRSRAAGCRQVARELGENWAGPLQLVIPGDFGVRKWWSALKPLLQIGNPLSEQQRVPIIHVALGERSTGENPAGEPFIAIPCRTEDLRGWRQDIEEEFDATTHIIDFDQDGAPPLLFGWVGQRLAANHRRGLFVVSDDNTQDRLGAVVHAMRSLRGANVVADVTAAGRIPTSEYDMVHMHAPWLGQNPETLTQVAAKMSVPSEVTTDAIVDWHEVGRSYNSLWAGRTRWLLAPDWSAPETWQPPLQAYLSAYTPNSNLSLQIYVAPNGRIGLHEAHDEVTRWLLSIGIDTEAMPPVEISGQMPINRTTWAIAAAGSQGLAQAFAERIVDVAGWEAICASR